MGMTTTIPLFNTRSGTAQRTITPGFYYDAEKDIYRCPANYELKPGKLLKNDYMLYHSRVTHCQNCIISCQAPKKKNRAIRVIARHTHFDLFQQVTLAMQTPLFKQKLVERLARIESVMNELKNYHCLAKARFRGIHNVQIQAYMAAIAINIKRIVFLFFINVLILLKYKLPFATGRVVF